MPGADICSSDEMLRFCIQELKMKKSDVISFFRSLKLKEYVNHGLNAFHENDPGQFFDTYNKDIINAFENYNSINE